MKLKLVENEKLNEFSDNPEPVEEDTVRVPVYVDAIFKYTLEVPKSKANDEELEYYVEETIKDLFPDEYDNWRIEDMDIDYTTKSAYDEERADEQRLMDDSEEATQVEDIPKKEEYKKMVTPDFKVGSKI